MKKILPVIRNIFCLMGIMAGTGLIITLLVASNKYQHDVRYRKLDVLIDHHTGLFFVTDEHVREVFRQHYPDSNIAISQINLYELERRLEQNPYVRKAQVYTDMKGTIGVMIVQKQPLLRIINSNGVSYYLDEKGNKMPVSDNFTARVPVVTGFVETTDRRRDTIVRKQLFDLVRFVQSDSLLYALCEQIDVSEKGEFEWIPKMGRHRFLLGDASALASKFMRMKIFYTEILTADTIQNYNVVNLKFNNQIICTKTI